MQELTEGAVHGTEINSGTEHANQSQHKSQKKELFVLTLRLVCVFRSDVDFHAMGHRPEFSVSGSASGCIQCDL